MERKRVRALSKARKLHNAHQPRESFFNSLLGVHPSDFFQSQLRSTSLTFKCSSHSGSSRISLPLDTVAACGSHVLLGCSSHRAVCAYDIRSGEFSSPLDLASPPIRIAVPEGDQSVCFVACQDAIEMLDSETQKTISTHITSDGTADGDVSVCGNFSVALNGDVETSIVTFFDHRGLHPVTNFSVQQKSMSHLNDLARRKVRILGAGPRVAVLMSDGNVHVLDLRCLRENPLRVVPVFGDVDPPRWQAGVMLPANPKHSGFVSTLASLGGEETFMTGSDTDGLRLWDTSSSLCVEHFVKCDGLFEPRTVRGSGSSSFYAFSNEDQLVTEWGVKNSSRPLMRFDRPLYWPRELCCAVAGDTFDGLVCGTVHGHFECWFRAF